MSWDLISTGKQRGEQAYFPHPLMILQSINRFRHFIPYRWFITRICKIMLSVQPVPFQAIRSISSRPVNQSFDAFSRSRQVHLFRPERNSLCVSNRFSAYSHIGSFGILKFLSLDEVLLRWRSVIRSNLTLEIRPQVMAWARHTSVKSMLKV